MSESTRREFLKKLGLGAAVAASPMVLGACLPVRGGHGGTNTHTLWSGGH